MGNLKTKMFKVSKINTLLLIALLLTLTSITTKKNSLGSSSNLPQIFENNQDIACSIKLFDNDYAFRTQNQIEFCALPSEWKKRYYKEIPKGKFYAPRNAPWLVEY